MLHAIQVLLLWKKDKPLAVFTLISIVALAVLLIASDWFIDAAEKIGLSLGVSPFIIGVTIVAFGTSLPELATSIASIYMGSSEIVVGNVVGSNIANILLVLGVTSFLGKKDIKLNFNIWKIDMPLLFASALLLLFALRDQQLDLLEALVFLVALGGFLFNSVKDSKLESMTQTPVRGGDVIKLIIGAVMVYFGADYTIYGITEIAEQTSIAPEFFSLSFIAIGTSLPELVVSIAAARRGKHAIAVGNVLGSNIFNTYAVMAIPSLMGELIVPESILTLGLPFMLGATLLFGLITISSRIARWEGFMLLFLYIFYLSELYKTI